MYGTWFWYHTVQNVLTFLNFGTVPYGTILSHIYFLEIIETYFLVSKPCVHYLSVEYQHITVPF